MHASGMEVDLLVHDVMRAPLDLVEDRADVFADDPKEDELHAAEDRDQHHQRCPPRRPVRTAKIDEHGEDCVQEPEAGKREADEDRGLKRAAGEGNHTVRGEADQPPKRILASPRRALTDGEANARAVESHPTDQTANELIALANASLEHPRDLSRDQAVIGRALVDWDVREEIDEPVEQPRRRALEPADVGRVLPDRVDDVTAPL